MSNSIYALFLIIIIIIIITLRRRSENFSNPTSSSVKEIVSSYWNKYLHFSDKRSKCFDCDNSSTLNHPQKCFDCENAENEIMKKYI